MDKLEMRIKHITGIMMALRNKMNGNTNIRMRSISKLLDEYMTYEGVDLSMDQEELDLMQELERKHTFD